MALSKRVQLPSLMLTRVAHIYLIAVKRRRFDWSVGPKEVVFTNNTWHYVRKGMSFFVICIFERLGNLLRIFIIVVPLARIVRRRASHSWNRWLPVAVRYWIELWLFCGHEELLGALDCRGLLPFFHFHCTTLQRKSVIFSIFVHFLWRSYNL